MEKSKEELPTNPIYTFYYQSALKCTTYFVARQLQMWYNDLDYLHEGQPHCDLTPDAERTQDNIMLTETTVARLFAYHYDRFYQVPELTEEEYAWILPYLEAYEAGEERTAFFTRAQVRYLLWLYEYRRVSVEWAGKLARRIACAYNDGQSNILLRIEDPEEMAREWEKAFRIYVESCRQKAGQWQAEHETSRGGSLEPEEDSGGKDSDSAASEEEISSWLEELKKNSRKHIREKLGM